VNRTTAECQDIQFLGQDSNLPPKESLKLINTYTTSLITTEWLKKGWTVRCSIPDMSNDHTAWHQFQTLRLISVLSYGNLEKKLTSTQQTIHLSLIPVSTMCSFTSIHQYIFMVSQIRHFTCDHYLYAYLLLMWLGQCIHYSNLLQAS